MCVDAQERPPQKLDEVLRRVRREQSGVRRDGAAACWRYASVVFPCPVQRCVSFLLCCTVCLDLVRVNALSHSGGAALA